MQILEEVLFFQLCTTEKQKNEQLRAISVGITCSFARFARVFCRRVLLDYLQFCQHYARLLSLCMTCSFARFKHGFCRYVLCAVLPSLHAAFVVMYYVQFCSLYARLLSLCITCSFARFTHGFCRYVLRAVLPALRAVFVVTYYVQFCQHDVRVTQLPLGIAAQHHISKQEICVLISVFFRTGSFHFMFFFRSSLELLTMASRRKDWKRISAESTLMSPGQPNSSRD